MNPEGNGEISNEFFKKLNQQIVQKDNLIKLLQLQIRNLKNQIESGSEGAEDSAELKKSLEEKSLEIEKVQAELNEQKTQFEAFSKEKEEQINDLNQLLEEFKTSGQSEAGSETPEDPRVSELENEVQQLRQELEQASELLSKASSEDSSSISADEIAAKDEEIVQLQKKIAELESAQTAVTQEADQIQQLRIAEEAIKAELEQARATIDQLSQQIQEKDTELEQLRLEVQQAPQEQNHESSSKILELEQDVETLKNLLAEKDEALASASGGSDVISANPELENQLKEAKAEIDILNNKIVEMQANPTLSPAIEEELSYLREEKSKIPDLEAKVEKLKAEAESYTETAMKVAALESEREQLVDELETLKEKAAQSDESAAEQSLKLEIVKLQEALEQKNDEVARLRVSIESSQDEGSSDPATREEIDQLTGQIADQLMAIQNFESMLQKAREQLEEKDKEIASLKEKLHQAGVSEDKVIPVTGDSEIISGFIDFFDGLDSMLVRNPIPELQTLHQKLLDRLIIPNQISYVPVISEQFDPEKHIATDYFRTDKFPEKCVVFEVEKGYAKGDTIIKKAKVWVVQNLFECQECKAMQSNPDSRFCHMCGAKMVAPNGLPVDNLPEFEPTPATYQRFAERMIEKDETEKAKDYLKQGLELDANFVPLLVKLGEILGAESEFEEALELLKKAYNLKQDRKIQEKISAIEVKLNIYKQAKSLHLDPEEFSKLVNLIKK